MKLLDKRNNILLILIVSLTGCNMVESTQRVIYEDKTPVMETRVHQWNEQTEYITYTNVLGEWSLTLEVGSDWELCIENPQDDYNEACYDGILTVDIDGNLTRN